MLIILSLQTEFDNGIPTTICREVENIKCLYQNIVKTGHGMFQKYCIEMSFNVYDSSSILNINSLFWHVFQHVPLIL